MVVHPAATRQSVPRAVRHNATASTATKAASSRCRHQLGVPLSPSRRAVSAGTLCVDTSCCCSPTAPRKPSACVPKPINPIAASTARLIAALATIASRSRRPRVPSNRNGSNSAAETLTPTPAISVAAAAGGRAAAPALSASAAASSSSSKVSLWAPATASPSSTGFRPTNAAAKRREWPSRPAARAISATAPRLLATASVLNAHNPPASPSGAVA